MRFLEKFIQLHHLCLRISILVILCGCKSSPPDQRFEPTRVSDYYARESVTSFNVYDIEIPHHKMGFFILKSGYRMPMLCKLNADGIHPIPQSVFTTQNQNAFHIICEPVTYETNGSMSYALTAIDLSHVDGDLLVNRKKLSLYKPTPKLIDRPR
jgi:hypothetical protein